MSKTIPLFSTENYTAYQFGTFYKETGLWIVFHHLGKMDGTFSLSTPSSCNPICKARMEAGDSVCKDCYTKGMLRCRKSLTKHLESNFEILNSKVYPVQKFEKLEIRSEDFPQGRIEAFGDQASVPQAKNNINFCTAHPNIRFGWWTKNMFLLEQASKELGLEKLPANISLVKSSEKLNQVSIPKSEFEIQNVKAVFTVYTLDWLLKHFNNDISKISQFVTCGGRNCRICGKCYNPYHEGVIYINEILKQDQKRAKKLGIDCGEYSEEEEAEIRKAIADGKIH